jgi:hypothetical protein
MEKLEREDVEEGGASHTAGPWVRVSLPDGTPGGTHWIIETNREGRRIAQMPDGSREDRANAALVVASPDLLTAAREALQALESISGSWLLKKDALAALRLALAKAEGRE